MQLLQNKSIGHNFARAFFLFGKRAFAQSDLVCLLFFYKIFFFASGVKTFNIDERESLAVRCLVYLSILPTNTINQITPYMYY